MGTGLQNAQLQARQLLEKLLDLEVRLASVELRGARSSCQASERLRSADALKHQWWPGLAGEI